MMNNKVMFFFISVVLALTALLLNLNGCRLSLGFEESSSTQSNYSRRQPVTMFIKNFGQELDYDCVIDKKIPIVDYVGAWVYFLLSLFGVTALIRFQAKNFYYRFGVRALLVANILLAMKIVSFGVYSIFSHKYLFGSYLLAALLVVGVLAFRGYRAIKLSKEPGWWFLGAIILLLIANVSLAYAIIEYKML